jgi:hypothetical protein
MTTPSRTDPPAATVRADGAVTCALRASRLLQRDARGRPLLVAALGYLGRQRVSLTDCFKSSSRPDSLRAQIGPAKFWMRLQPAGKAAEAVLVPSPEERSNNRAGAFQDFGAAGPVVTRARIRSKKHDYWK